MGKELEFKLAAANDAILDCLLGDPETAARMEGPIVCTPMETTYFDTETNAFRTNHWTLRRRQEGSRSVVCVKTPQPEPFARGEWEVEARAVDDAAIEWLLDFGAPRQLLQLYGPCAARGSCAAASCSVWQTAAAPSWRATAACCTAKRRSFHLPRSSWRARRARRTPQRPLPTGWRSSIICAGSR